MSPTPLRPSRQLLTVGSLLLLAACGGASSRLQDHMSRGRDFLAQENVEKARVEFGNALQIAPEDPEARYYSGVVAERLGKPRDAVGMYQAAIDKRPDYDQARAALGRVFVLGGVPDRALETIAPALVRDPDDADLLTVRAAARLQMKETAAATEDATRAIAVAPDNESAVALMASIHRQAGETGKAISLVESALAKKPKSIDLRQILASLQLSAGDFGAAIDAQRGVVDLRPDVLPYRLQLALLQTRAKRTDDAEKTLRGAIDALPDNVEAKLAYVDFLASQRSPDAAQEALRGLIVKAPKDFGLQLGLGDLERRAGKADAARATWSKVVDAAAEAPQALEARNRIAAMDVEAKRYEPALAQIKQVLDKDPRNVDALLLRGNISLQQRKAPEAIADLRAVLRDKPDSVGVRRTLARAHLANGEPALAEDNLRAAVDASPGDVSPRLELAQLLLQTQRAEAAATLLEKAVLDAPGNASARELLVRAYLARNDLPAAKIAAEDLKTLRPDLAVGAFLAAVTADAQGRVDDAAREYEAALKLQPEAMDALAGLTRLDLRRGRADAALERVQKVVTAKPSNPIGLNLLAELHLGLKSYPKAVEAATEVVRLAPAWPIGRRNLALARLGAGDAAGGVEAFKAGIQATDQDAGLVTEYAALLEQQGKVDAAMAVYEALHKKNPKLELAANNLAMLLVTYRRADRASLDRAYELVSPFSSSANPALLDTYGWVRLSRGETAEALPVLERASLKAPDSKVIRYHLAMAQLKAGQNDRARLNLEDALAGTTAFAGIDEAKSALAELRRRG